MNIDFEKGGGLVPVVVQHYTTGEVLMVGYGNSESMARCAETGELWLYSRSRQQLWHKGETSGHFQVVKDIAFDCDGDTLLIQVEQTGAACHENYKSCFFRSLTDKDGNFKITEPRLE